MIIFKRVMIDTGLKKRVKSSKAVTVLKQDRQAFGTPLSKSVDLELLDSHEAIERMHSQTYYWLRFNDRIPDSIDYSKNGWKDEPGIVVPIWFTGKYI